MPTNRDFKRLVRRRMQKTGESYTTARAHLVKQRPRTTSVPPGPLPDYAALAGYSDAAVKRATGCTWEKWVEALDYAGAAAWPHRAIAEHVRATWKVPDWWGQMVTVGYERIKGLREKGQRRGGTWDANRSRTAQVPVRKLYNAFRQARTRAKWFGDGEVRVMKATPDTSVRMKLEDGTVALAWFTAKGPDKSQVQVQVSGLSDRAAVDRVKAEWGDRLQRLSVLLDG